jgi:PAS domain S-box-containing protein
MPQDHKVYLPPGGTIGELIRSYDWSKTLLGPMDQWPQTLLTNLATILQSPLPQLICWGRKLTMLYNDEYIELLGDKHPALGKHLMETWPEAGKILKPLIDKAFSGKPVRVKKAPLPHMRHDSPEQAWYDFSCSPLFDVDGKVAGFLNTTIAVIECKDFPAQSEFENTRILHTLQNYREEMQVQNEELTVINEELQVQNAQLQATRSELISSNQKYQDLFDSAPVGYVIINERGVIYQANKTFADISHDDSEKSSGKKLYDYISDDTKDVLFGTIRKSKKSNNVESATLNILSGDHTLHISLRCKSFPLSGQGMYLCSLQDISDLKESEQRFRTMADGLPLIIWVHDTEGKQQFVNRTFYEFFGLTPEEMTPEKWTSLTDPETGTPYAEEFVACVREQRPFHGEVRGKRADGKWRWIESWGRPQYSISGEYSAFVGTSADITERKQAEEALIESEDKFRLFFSTSPAFLVVSDPKSGRHIEVNDAYCALSGYSREEVIGKTSIELGIIDPKSREERVRETVIGGGEKRGIELDLLRKNGEIRRIVFSSSIIEQGGRQFFISSGFDITAENALRKSEARYRELVQNANSAIIRWKSDGTVTFFNEYAQSFFGYSAEEAVGRHVSFMVPEKESTGTDLSGLVQDIVANPERYVNFVNENVRKDGSRVWMAWTNKPIFNAEGEVIGFLAVGSDITERKRAEDRLRESEERNRLVKLSTNDVLWDWDLKTNAQTWEGNVINAFGLLTEDLGATAQGWYDRIHPDDHERVTEKIHAAIKGGDEFWTDEYRFRCADDRWKYFLDRAYILRDAAGVAYRMIGIMQDITKRKRAEEALHDLAKSLEIKVKERTSELEHANRAKDEFLANMSHEIRTPMAGVFGLTEILLHQDLPERVGADLEMIRSSAKSVLTLLNDLFDLSRISQGKFEFHPTVCDFRSMVEEALGPFRYQALSKDLDFIVSIDEGIPHQILCDNDRLGQVIKNMVSNAIKFTDHGFVKVEAKAEKLDAETLLLHVSVADSGLGIPKSRQKDVFNAFTQLDPSYSKKFAGMGLGLAISKSLIEGMGGEITLVSSKGKGATFRFHVTCGIVTGEQALKTPTMTLNDLPSLTILLAEDNPVVRLFLRRALVTAGHKVAEAEDGKHALTKLGETEFDLVLMDIQMPEMDGVEATRRIRSGKHGRADIPIIALTAYAMKGDREKFLEGGMDGYVTKPVDFGELARVIAEVCGIQEGGSSHDCH